MTHPRRALALGLLLLVLLPGPAAAPPPSRDAADLGRLTQVLDFIREEYAGEVDTEQLVDGAIQGVMEKLDPHSRYFDAAAFEDLHAGTSGGYGGIGVGLGVREGRAIVLSVTPGSPAARAGVRVADRILSVDGAPVRGLDAAGVGRMLRGPVRTRVGIHLCTGAGTIRDVTVMRGLVAIPSVSAAMILGDRVAYMRIEQFSERTSEEFRVAMERLSAERPRAMVLDLRGNPGGVLTEAVSVAEHFVPRGKLIVTTEGRHPSQDRLYFSSTAQPRIDVPLAVLVDEGTASAAEVLAGALQDWDLALVIGGRTYGKGSVQTIVPLEGGGGIKLTTARYFTPSGRSFDRPAGIADASPAGASGSIPAAAPGAPWAFRESRAELPGTEGSSRDPLFVTASGRFMRGGGGIDPDVTIASPKLDGLLADLENGGYFTTFAYEAEAGPPSDRVAQFRAYIEADLVAAGSGDWSGTAPGIAWRIRREEARRSGGNEAAVRIALAHDPVYERAVALLESGQSLSQMLHEVERTGSR